MALVKLELLPLPALREIGERLWFKIELDSKAKWRPDGWLDPGRDEDIQAALQDSTLTSLDDRIKHLFRNNRPRKVRMRDAASCSATETSSPSPDRSERHIQSCGMKGENDFSSKNRWRRRH